MKKVSLTDVNDHIEELKLILKMLQDPSTYKYAKPFIHQIGLDALDDAEETIKQLDKQMKK